MTTERTDSRSQLAVREAYIVRSGTSARSIEQERCDELIVVQSAQAVRDLAAYLLLMERVDPVVAMSTRDGACDPLLPYASVRGVVGDQARIYLVADELLLRSLRGAIGPRFALLRPAIRVWWPGLPYATDPADHPCTVAVDGESSKALLAEFARRFDLSRPRVRREMKLVEEMRALAEHQLDDANRRLGVTQRRTRSARHGTGEAAEVAHGIGHEDVA